MSDQPLQITLISPYAGGSHAAWASGYARHSAHEVSRLNMPARFWKWRMHGGAVTMARRYLQEGEQPDLILATDMLDLTTFLALTRPETEKIPVALYMHENQLTYPLPADPNRGPMRRQKGERDLHYAFINYASMLAADVVLFNSHYHRRSLLAALPNFLKHFPDYHELETVELLEQKSAVLPVGVDFAGLHAPSRPPSAGPDDGPLILWNQRWEYDKNPSAFFRALYRMQEEGLPFQLALCGQSFRRRPREFEEAQERLADRIVHVGFAPRQRYRELLWQADITISTARHEFFGISIIEAMGCNTFPILPHGLSYPELLPEAFHNRCLYADEEGLFERLRWALTQPQEAKAVARDLAPSARYFSWSNVARYYDALLMEIEDN